MTFPPVTTKDCIQSGLEGIVRRYKILWTEGSDGLVHGVAEEPDVTQQLNNKLENKDL